MAQEDVIEIMRALGGIEGKIDAIDAHLVTLNHRTEKSEEEIIKLKMIGAEQKGGWKVFTFLAGGSGVLGAAIAKTLFK